LRNDIVFLEKPLFVFNGLFKLYTDTDKTGIRLDELIKKLLIVQNSEAVWSH
jgi:hypothetical protein